MTDGGEGPKRRWKDRLPRDTAVTVCVTILGAMALTSIILLIYGAGEHSTHTMANGGDWLFFAFFLALPGRIGWWLRGRQRKIKVEQKLDNVQEGLDRVEDLLTGDQGRDAVVRPIRRLGPVPR